MPAEKRRFSSSERALLATFRQLAAPKPGGKIELLWEWNDEKLQTEKEQQANFIFYAGEQFSNELAKEKNKRVIFTSADTYRFNRFHMITMLVHPRYKTIYEFFLDKKLADAVALITEILGSDRKAQKDITQVQKKVGRQIYEKLFAQWQAYKDKKLRPFYQENFQPALQKEKNITIRAFHQSLGGVQSDNVRKLIEKFSPIVAQPVMDFELLFKIFGSPHRHVIIYAGGTHCINVSESLMKDFNFQEVINVGMFPFPARLYSRVTLSSDAWTLLSESPQDSLNRFKAKGALKKLVYDDYWKNVDLSLSSVQKLEKVIKEGFQAYVQVVNAQDRSGMTLLHYVASRSDKVPLAQVLFKYGANPNIQDVRGRTPLFIAVFYGANAMVEFLLQQGVDTTIRDANGQTPLDTAIEANRPEIVKTLKSAKK